MNANSSENTVVVVGAGPTGLMLACDLKLMGVDVEVLERRAHNTTGESRAPGIMARTMELFTQRGLAARFLEKGRVMPFVVFSGMPIATGADWPRGLILPQHETERILADRARELGVRFRWATELVHLKQDENGVSLWVEGAGEPRLRAAYVVGCDGGHSKVRRLVGTHFEGDDPLSHWLVADVQLDAPPPDQAPFGRNDRVGTYQISQVEPGWYRVSIMRMTPPIDRSAPVTLEELRNAMLGGISCDFGLRRARWMSRFTDGFRQATAYRHGRVLLAGDAAHTHAPIGGQGLNLGIQDAVNLGWKLAAVLQGASPQLLDTYHAERHAIAKEVLRLARAQTALIKPGNQIEDLRSVVGDMLEVPEVSRRLAGFLSGLDLRYSFGDDHPLLGRRMPDVDLRSGRPVLLDFTGSQELPSAFAGRIDHVCAQRESWNLSVVGEVPPLTAAFVRPDGYVAWVGPSRERLSAALARWLS